MSLRIKGILDTLSTVLVITAAVALLWKILGPAPSNQTATQPILNVSGLSIPADRVTHTRGSGRLALVEFSDFECPFCSQHQRLTAPKIDSDFIGPGNLQLVFFNFPLSIHSHAEKASEAAECAGRQGRFWEMHNRLFEEPAKLDAAALTTNAEAIGLDEPQFSNCLKSGVTSARIQADMAEGRRLGVNSTPTFFVGIRQTDGSIALVARIDGAVPFDRFKEAINLLTSAQQRKR